MYVRVIRNFIVNACTTEIRVWHKLSQRTLSPQISKLRIQKQLLVFERNKINTNEKVLLNQNPNEHAWTKTYK